MIERDAALQPWPLVVLVLVSSVSGCLEGEPASPRETPEMQAFREHAEPVLMERCANPSCHGRSDRPLSLYAPQRHREDSADTFLTTPLTEREHLRNYLQSRSFVASPAGRSELLRKPLDRSSGGSGHEGGAIFRDTSDYDYRRLLTWLEQELAADPEP